MDARPAWIISLGVAAVLSGCASDRLTPAAALPYPTDVASPRSSPGSVATTYGTVTGGMFRCFGLPEFLSGPPTRVAGTVSVFRGPNDGLPEEIVQTDGEYSIKLPPGEYVLVGHWAGSNLAPPMVTMQVTSGTITRQDLDYRGCR